MVPSVLDKGKGKVTGMLNIDARKCTDNLTLTLFGFKDENISQLVDVPFEIPQRVHTMKM